MFRIIRRVAVNALALYLAVYLVPGFDVVGGLSEYLVAGLVLGLLNLTLKPILKILSLPLIVLTFGLFSLIINALILEALSLLVPFVIISGFAALFLATFVIAVVNTVLAHNKL